jgi:hypothetical protein
MQSLLAHEPKKKPCLVFFLHNVYFEFPWESL